MRSRQAAQGTVGRCGGTLTKGDQVRHQSLILQSGDFRLYSADILQVQPCVFLLGRVTEYEGRVCVLVGGGKRKSSFLNTASMNVGILIMGTMDNSRVIKKSTRPPHFGECENRLSFYDCYELIANSPSKIFSTTGNQTPFSARATVCKKGPHAGEEVIIFLAHGTEKARAYSCCWGHITNCNRTYIDCFTRAIDRD
jgi:hypothetical protein